ncbi:hypothetical protein HBI81_196400 [Parastagonospora nodorum]|nr:hypothetical protein HBH42_173560 [Parastagonospora nodorum]KAH4256745.1 hypothetical protein HBI03_161980 [Parastagonospora nodorum]KAH4269564.1 hypothetical protein HBI04_156980 [Parastagonospora nodorum]KAH5305909.1 hypothetical protein HBI50_180060 [Parastagonospora nodorum]KAH6515424.1 hypothetical protein HBI81_196400 [Parastagonospora nodorum]
MNSNIPLHRFISLVAGRGICYNGHRPSLVRLWNPTPEARSQTLPRYLVPSYPVPPKLKVLNACNYTTQCRSRVNICMKEEVPFSPVHTTSIVCPFSKGYLVSK